MPIFKIRATEEVRTTCEIYVDALDAKTADAYAAGLECLQDVRGAHVTDAHSIGSEIEAVDQVDAAPEGVIPIKAQWRGGLASLRSR
jgi:hypothetical protein